MGTQSVMAMLGGRYRLVERLGAGGMSVVWRAFDEVLGRQVAVKVLAGEFAGDPAFRRAIRREARAVARLTHPHIGVVYDYGEWRDSSGVAAPYVVMELIDGQSLEERLRAGTLPWRSAAGICAQIASALRAAHARGLVHRDVKPANIMLCGTGVKVVDFGISALAGEQVDGDGDILQGTPGYVAPERLIGAPVGAAVDVYALGIVFFKALTGRLPWTARDEAEMLAAHLTARPQPLPPVDGLPAEAGDLYLRCLAKDPRDRPDAGEVAAILNGAGGLAPIGALEAGAAGAGLNQEPTTLLPSPGTAPLALAGVARVPGHGGGTRPLPARRRLAGLALIPLAVAAGALYLSTTGDHPAAPVPVDGDGPLCAVTYRVGSDDGTTFSGTLTLRAREAPPADGWTVSFDLPAQQTFQAAAPAASSQDGAHVVVRLTRPGATAGAGQVIVPFTGSDRGTNPMPAGFVLSGHPCTPLLLGPTGTPSSSPTPTRNADSARHPARPAAPAAGGPAPGGPAPGGPAPAAPANPAGHTPPGHAEGHGKPAKSNGDK
jgi:serine/threonine-protein kinase